MRKIPLPTSFLATRILVLLVAGSLGCAAQVAPRAAEVVALEGEPHLAVRVEAGTVWTSARPWTEPRRTWSAPARGPVEQLAVRALPEGGGFEVTFRQGGGLWRGELDAERGTRGPLQAVARPSGGAAATVANMQR
jgi:hypothetical protein